MKLTAKVESIIQIAENTFEVTFDTDNSGFRFKAGEYITVTLPNLQNLEAKEQFRDFSVASSPNKLPLLSIIFRKSESAFKKEILNLNKGSEVIIEGPSGIFTLPDDAKRPLVFIAGGVGVAPFFSMLNFISETNLTCRISLIYCNRGPESSAYLADIEDLSDRTPAIRLVKVFGPLEERHFSSLIPQNPIWYIAGPPGMVKTARNILVKSGIIDNDIKTEEFSGY